MSKNTVSLHGFDIVRRHDASFAVYDYAWWPDPDLDDDPERNARWLAATEGWRAKGWQVVHVAPTLASARAWANLNRSI